MMLRSSRPWNVEAANWNQLLSGTYQLRVFPVAHVGEEVSQLCFSLLCEMKMITTLN